MKKLLVVLGTRPEAIKLAPIIKTFKDKSEFEMRVCSTGQHKEMLTQVLNFFNIIPDYELKVMKSNQSLSELTLNLLKGIDKVLKEYLPDLIFVQGDTTTAFIAALGSFYKKIPIAHIEAGLRSFDKYSPYPEELNRVLISHIVDYHFSPTQKAKDNLYKEGIKNNVYVVGNTVIDALLMGIKTIKNNDALRNNIEKSLILYPIQEIQN